MGGWGVQHTSSWWNKWNECWVIQYQYYLIASNSLHCKQVNRLKDSCEQAQSSHELTTNRIRVCRILSTTQALCTFRRYRVLSTTSELHECSLSWQVCTVFTFHLFICLRQVQDGRLGISLVKLPSFLFSALSLSAQLMDALAKKPTYALNTTDGAEARTNHATTSIAIMARICILHTNILLYI